MQNFTKPTRRQLSVAMAGTALLIAMAPLSAQAQLNLDTARSEGIVGETRDGMLAALVNRPDVIQLVETINAQRMQAYQTIAREEGISLGQVQAIAAEKIFQRLPAGAVLMDQNGQWARK